MGKDKKQNHKNNPPKAIVLHDKFKTNKKLEPGYCVNCSNELLNGFCHKCIQDENLLDAPKEVVNNHPYFHPYWKEAQKKKESNPGKEEFNKIRLELLCTAESDTVNFEQVTRTNEVYNAYFSSKLAKPIRFVLRRNENEVIWNKIRKNNVIEELKVSEVLAFGLDKVAKQYTLEVIKEILKLSKEVHGTGNVKTIEPEPKESQHYVLVNTWRNGDNIRLIFNPILKERGAQTIDYTMSFYSDNGTDHMIQFMENNRVLQEKEIEELKLKELETIYTYQRAKELANLNVIDTLAMKFKKENKQTGDNILMDYRDGKGIYVTEEILQITSVLYNPVFNRYFTGKRKKPWTKKRDKAMYFLDNESVLQYLKNLKKWSKTSPINPEDVDKLIESTEIEVFVKRLKNKI